MSMLRNARSRLMRKKTIGDARDESQHTELARCLTTTDLVALGVGSTLGAGVYVLTGSVARDKTGPAIILSFLVAALASVMAGTSSVARAWSENFDALIGGRFRNFSLTHLRLDAPGFAQYPDFFAFAIILILTAVLCFGVKESARFSKIFTLINVVVILFVIIAGSISADTGNWNLTSKDIESFLNKKCSAVNQSAVACNMTSASANSSCSDIDTWRFGTGGFLPYGFSGMMSGAATCFFGFVGFDIIATTGEEVINPQRSIPLSIVLSLLVVFCAYVGISTVLTLMVPYYVLDVGAPLPRAFDVVGWNWSVYPLAIGATCALSSSLMGGLFPMPRIVYAMAQDGLIFRFLGNISKRFKTPLIATLVSGILAAVMVLIFDLEDLVDMMSIGTLLAYTLVAMCVLILRYLPYDTTKGGCRVFDHGKNSVHNLESSRSWCAQAFFPRSEIPTKKSGSLVYSCTMLIGLLSFLLCAVIVHSASIPSTVVIIICTTTLLLIATLTLIIIRQPQSKIQLSFKVPLVPLLPILSTICNVYLMCELSIGTWVRFAVWMAIGFVIYGAYGYRNSSEGEKYRQNVRREDGLERIKQSLI